MFLYLLTDIWMPMRGSTSWVRMGRSAATRWRMLRTPDWWGPSVPSDHSTQSHSTTTISNTMSLVSFIHTHNQLSVVSLRFHNSLRWLLQTIPPYLLSYPFFAFLSKYLHIELHKWLIKNVGRYWIQNYPRQNLEKNSLHHSIYWVAQSVEAWFFLNVFSNTV